MSEVEDIEHQAAHARRRHETLGVLDQAQALRSSIGSMLAFAKLLADNRDSNLSAKQIDYAQAIYAAGTDMLVLLDEMVRKIGERGGAGRAAAMPPPYPLFARREAVARHPYRGRRSRRVDDGAVLIVGNDEAVAEALQQRVREEGYDCDRASNPDAAKAMLRQQLPDAVIVVSGPDAEAAAALAVLNGEAEGSGLPVFVLDARAGRHACRESAEDRRVPETGCGVDAGGTPGESAGADCVDCGLDDAIDQAMRFLQQAIGTPLLPRRRIPTRRRRGPLDLVGRKVLIVDDDVRNLYAMTGALEQQGMLVMHAESGAQAATMLDDHPDTAAVLMGAMPAAPDGDIIALMRGRAGFAALPVIALTSGAGGDERERCIAAGASDHLAKPVNDERLIALLRAWLKR